MDFIQYKGDPSIRGNLLFQTRSASVLDENIDEAIAFCVDLMLNRGVHHVMLHFSSNRAVVWLTESPLEYLLIDHAEMLSDAALKRYPKKNYPKNAAVPAASIETIFAIFKKLRLADENVYLRTGTLNLFNGIVGLTFSCDGTHYVDHSSFVSEYAALALGTAA